MNFVNLKYFLVVAEEGNITRAAERLYISQQALSNHIAKLEEELGNKLFTRSPIFELTYAGRTLQKKAAQILDLQHQLQVEMDDITNKTRSELRIGISHTCGRALLPDVLPYFHTAHPQIDISLNEGNSKELEDALTHGMIDLIIGYSPISVEDVETIPLARERLFLMVPQAFMNEIYGDRADYMRGKFTMSADVTVFNDMPFIFIKKGNRVRSIIDEYMAKLGMTPTILLETENTETAFSLAEKGMGIAIYPKLFLGYIHNDLLHFSIPTIDFFPLNDLTTIGTLVIGYKRDRYLSKAAEEFIMLTQKSVKRWESMQI